MDFPDATYNWIFPEGLGNTTADEGTAGDTGTLNNMTDSCWIRGYGNSGFALNFNRFGQWSQSVSFLSSNSYVQGNFTISFWARPVVPQPMNIQQSNTGVANVTALNSIMASTDGVTFQLPNSAGCSVHVGTNGIVVIESNGSEYVAPTLVYHTVVNTWILISLVYSNNMPILYINGNYAATGLQSTYGVGFNPSTLGFGLGNYYIGALDDIVVYSQALSATYVQFYYNQSIAQSKHNSRLLVIVLIIFHRSGSHICLLLIR